MGGERGYDEEAHALAGVLVASCCCGGGTQEKAKEIHLLDGKVLQNAGIALAKYKMAPADLVKAILAMDDKLFGREEGGAAHTHTHRRADSQQTDAQTTHSSGRSRRAETQARCLL